MSVIRGVGQVCRVGDEGLVAQWPCPPSREAAWVWPAPVGAGVDLSCHGLWCAGRTRDDDGRCCAARVPAERVDQGWVEGQPGGVVDHLLHGACVFVFPNEFRKIRVQRW